MYIAYPKACKELNWRTSLLLSLHVIIWILTPPNLNKIGENTLKKNIDMEKGENSLPLRGFNEKSLILMSSH